MTLHDAIAAVLRDGGQSGLPVSEIHRRVVSRGLFHQRDGGTVSLQQVHARLRDYGNLFELDRSTRPITVRLREKALRGRPAFAHRLEEEMLDALHKANHAHRNTP
jgi:hypothetical protein